MNPHWVQTAYTITKAARVCPHCKKRGVYPRKQAGQFHTCKFCQHKFKEKGE